MFWSKSDYTKYLKPGRWWSSPTDGTDNNTEETFINQLTIKFDDGESRAWTHGPYPTAEDACDASPFEEFEKWFRNFRGSHSYELRAVESTTVFTKASIKRYTISVIRSK